MMVENRLLCPDCNRFASVSLVVAPGGTLMKCSLCQAEFLESLHPPKVSIVADETRSEAGRANGFDRR